MRPSGGVEDWFRSEHQNYGNVRTAPGEAMRQVSRSPSISSQASARSNNSYRSRQEDDVLPVFTHQRSLSSRSSRSSASDAASQISNGMSRSSRRSSSAQLISARGPSPRPLPGEEMRTLKFNRTPSVSNASYRSSSSRR